MTLVDRTDVVAGMAWFKNTGPAGKTCGDCRHRGYYRARSIINPKTGLWEDRLKKWQGCVMFRKLKGREGRELKPDLPSCREFEQKT
jgi:hypothetical protein